MPGLRASNVWYGHEQAVTWIQSVLPDGFCFAAHLAQTYAESGWCFVESAISAGVKVGSRRLDIAKAVGSQFKAYGGSGWVAKVKLEMVCAAQRSPPLLPTEVRRSLDEEKKFTSKSDVGTVDNLYRSFFDSVTSTATRLNFRELAWGDEEATQLVIVLPYFAKLATLDLSSNAIGAQGAAALAGWLRVCTSSMGARSDDQGSLTDCNLLKNKFDSETATMLAQISKEKKISLCGIMPEQTEANFGYYSPSGIVPEQMLKPADAILVAAAMHFRSSITQVRTLLSRAPLILCPPVITVLVVLCI